MKNLLVQKHTFRRNKRPWLPGMAFVAVVAGCGGGHSNAASIQMSTPSLPVKAPYLPSKLSPLPPKATTTPPPASTLPVNTKVLFNCAAGAVTCVEVTSTGPQTQASLPLTFGQPFKAGDWQHNSQGLIAQVDGASVPLQTDGISSHRDGSARFAVLSTQLTNVQSGQKRIINFYTAQKSTPTSMAPVEPDWNLELEVQLYDASNNVVSTLVALPQAQLKTQIAQNAGQRLKGPVTTEYTVVTGFKNKATGQEHPHLSARLHTRLYEDGQRIRTDVVLENTRTWTPAPANFTYDLTIKRHGTVLHKQPRFTHYHHARWHKVVWSGNAQAPLAKVRHHMPYFIASKAVMNYNLALPDTETLLASEASQLAKARLLQADLGPMGNARLNPYFPSTGGRPERGPVPFWTALYLVTQDQRAMDSMMANADASAAVPIHHRDEKTDYPIDLDTYPKASLRSGNSIPVVPKASDSTIWSPDIAHQSSFTYIPYLVTGDLFHLEGMMFWAAYNMMSLNPEYRQGTLGIVEPTEVRGQAWAMRSLWEVYTSLPDSHPRKAYHAKRLENNLNYYANKYVAGNSVIPPLGMVVSSQTGGGDIAPWQNDFMALTWSLMAENDEPKAKVFLDWISRFTVGRFMSDEQGFCAAKAAEYYWKPKDPSGNFFKSFNALFDINYPTLENTPCEQILPPNTACAECYPGIALAMLAAAHNAKVSNAGTAYERWYKMNPNNVKALEKDPRWSIIPRP